MTEGDNRRRRRIAISLEASWSGASGGGKVRVGDLSASGCYVDALMQAAVGERALLKIRLAASEWIECEGIVRYTQFPSGFGVEFTKMSEDVRARLQRFIDSQR